MPNMNPMLVVLALLAAGLLISVLLSILLMQLACNSHLGIYDLWCSFGRVLKYASYVLLGSIALVAVLIAIKP